VKLAPGESEAVANFLGIAEEEFSERYTRLSPDRQCLSLTERADGGCIFLEDVSGAPARCVIDPVKPRQCRDFPERWNFPGWQDECPGRFEGS